LSYNQSLFLKNEEEQEKEKIGHKKCAFSIQSRTQKLRPNSSLVSGGPPHLLLRDLEPDAALEAKLGEEHVHDGLGVGEPQHHVADVGKPERLDVRQLVEVGLDQEDGQVVHGGPRGKPVVDDDGVKAKPEGEEGDEQRDGDGDDVDDVAPGAVGVPQLHGEAEAPLGEGAVLPAEEDLGGGGNKTLEQNRARWSSTQIRTRWSSRRMLKYS
jgi:hypothetical protein